MIELCLWIVHFRFVVALLYICMYSNRTPCLFIGLKKNFLPWTHSSGATFSCVSTFYNRIFRGFGEECKRFTPNQPTFFAYYLRHFNLIEDVYASRMIYVINFRHKSVCVCTAAVWWCWQRNHRNTWINKIVAPTKWLNH